ncbi:MAG: hypothetical protein ABS32_01605 [Verrucomicrobia subdivision 6 bacterium BACL9 MAG-120820-bin42]|uniref:Uncharacterized protein n=1 Tax=Verrucomicrobia subdivision 6 bacterium BACL9 MAG-120820-bin42 TaxID=1655634 RepID=A0A0R2XGE6_9BACT|nr:MAG: hypothetical protein ABS32_01605 [Verrucomicrobia subdivision 6 bacterium BACL9 MAG-120820-bin42]
MATDDPLADLNLGRAGGGEVEVGSGAEANHADSFSRGDAIARFFPANDSAGDEAGNLPDQDGALGGTQEPGLVFVTEIDLQVAGVEEFTRGVVGFFNRGGKGATVDVDIEDGKENAHAAKLPETKTGVFRFIDTNDFAIRRTDQGERVGGGSSGWVSEKK